MHKAACAELALVTLVRVEKPLRWLNGTNKDFDTWYQSRVPIFELTL